MSSKTFEQRFFRMLNSSFDASLGSQWAKLDPSVRVRNLDLLRHVMSIPKIKLPEPLRRVFVVDLAVTSEFYEMNHWYGLHRSAPKPKELSAAAVVLLRMPSMFGPRGNEMYEVPSEAYDQPHAVLDELVMRVTRDLQQHGMPFLDTLSSEQTLLNYLIDFPRRPPMGVMFPNGQAQAWGTAAYLALSLGQIDLADKLHRESQSASTVRACVKILDDRFQATRARWMMEVVEDKR